MLSRGHSRLEKMGVNLITNVLIKRNLDRDTQERKPLKDGGRLWNDMVV